MRAPESFVSAGEASQLKSNGDGRAGALLLAERRTLELIADGAALIEILEELCRTVDAQQPDVISTVLLTDTDGKRLWPAAGPRIPTAWTKAITPLPIGPDIGACGTAAFLKQTVIVSDIATDPLFDTADYRSLALSHGLCAAWSQPLVSKDGEVLGTFGMYYAEPREPSADDLQLIGGAAHIAMIAVQRDRTQKELERAYQDIKQSEEKLRQDEEELRRITDLIPQTIIVLSPDGRAVYANRVVLDYTGLSIEEVRAEDFRSRVFHPDDVQRLREERSKTLAGIAPFENEQRALGKDGKYRWVLVRYNPFLDEEGQVIRWYATGTDIDERKRAEDRARNESVALREEIVRSSMFEEIVGSSDELRKVLAQVARVAPADSTVLIQGETGTGKELIARAIHKSSRRATRAFIRVNCGAIPTSLIASELFGHNAQISILCFALRPLLARRGVEGPAFTSVFQVSPNITSNTAPNYSNVNLASTAHPTMMCLFGEGSAHPFAGAIKPVTCNACARRRSKALSCLRVAVVEFFVLVARELPVNAKLALVPFRFEDHSALA